MSDRVTLHETYARECGFGEYELPPNSELDQLDEHPERSDAEIWRDESAYSIQGELGGARLAVVEDAPELAGRIRLPENVNSADELRVLRVWDGYHAEPRVLVRWIEDYNRGWRDTGAAWRQTTGR